MSMKDLLLELAIESGQLEPEQPETADQDELVAELIEMHSAEMHRAINLVESLESIQRRFEEVPFSSESLESARFAVHHVLYASGAAIPAEVITASFEAGENGKGSAGQRIKDAIKRILAWLAEQWDRLLKFLRIRKQGMVQKNAVAEKATQKVKETIKSLPHNPGPTKAKAGERYHGSGLDNPSQKHGSADSTDRQPSAGVQGQLKFPKWLIKGGKLNEDGIRKVVSAVENPKTWLGEPPGDFSKGKAEEIYNSFKKYHDEDVVRKHYQQFIDTLYSSGDGGSLTTYDLSAIEGAVTKLNDCLKKTVEFFDQYDELMKELSETINRKLSKITDEKELAFMKKVAALTTATMPRLQEVVGKLHKELFDAHSALCKFVEQVKRNAA